MFEIKLFMHYTLITTVNYNLESAQIKFHQGYTKDRPHNYPWYWEGETLPLQIKRKMVSRYYRFYASIFSFFCFCTVVVCVSDYQGLDWRKNFGHKSAGWCELWSDHPSFISQACFSILQMSKDFSQHTLLMIYIFETYHRNNAILISNVLKSFPQNTVLSSKFFV